MWKMISKIKQIIQKFFGVKAYCKLKSLLDRFIFSYKKIHYSQYGEDVFLDAYFPNVNKGFYIDVGAYHPRQCSNTYLLYMKGWRGLVIDASENIKPLFNSIRPRDVAVEALVAESECDVEFYSWGNHLENSGCKVQIAALLQTLGDPEEIIVKKAKSLKQIMDENLPEGVSGIDLLSVDVEGMDLEVLRSFDWERWQPTIIIVEFFSEEIKSIIESEIYRFILAKKYRLVSWSKPSLIFESIINSESS